ncbi:hypothetical protein TIFTF001_053467 [Ficus carica]|uniref:Uncharacterized protein n=1 Tax=Ficus carica TaxID=3494 RepID=A0AA88JGY3_FICCA|nr:hypothetical protein TIFTF001_046793 [Ficus carica]GMN70352.1 hypothetical protein TIFTF001_039396 [Ficus carica]GMN71871.1 hypothetical protein TIFTF001_053467 [Ficus carica]
MWDGHCHGF